MKDVPPLIGLRYIAAARLGSLRVVRLAETPRGLTIMDGIVYPVAEEAARYHEKTIGYMIWWRGWRLVVRTFPAWAYQAAAAVTTSVMWAALVVVAEVGIHRA